MADGCEKIKRSKQKKKRKEKKRNGTAGKQDSKNGST
jgi:hypothetical protein